MFERQHCCGKLWGTKEGDSRELGETEEGNFEEIGGTEEGDCGELGGTAFGVFWLSQLAKQESGDLRLFFIIEKYIFEKK